MKYFFQPLRLAKQRKHQICNPVVDSSVLRDKLSRTSNHLPLIALLFHKTCEIRTCSLAVILVISYLGKPVRCTDFRDMTKKMLAPNKQTRIQNETNKYCVHVAPVKAVTDFKKIPQCYFFILNCIKAISMLIQAQ